MTKRVNETNEEYNARDRVYRRQLLSDPIKRARFNELQRLGHKRREAEGPTEKINRRLAKQRYRSRHPERIRAQNRALARKRAKTLTRQWATAYYASHLDQRRAHGRKSGKRFRDECPEMVMWYHAREKARRFKVEFDLTADDIVIPTHCEVSGVELIRGQRRLLRSSPCLCRRDLSGGFTKDNVWIISFSAFAKLSRAWQLTQGAIS